MAQFENSPPKTYYARKCNAGNDNNYPTLPNTSNRKLNTTKKSLAKCLLASGVPHLIGHL
eukprot:4998883-Amphidinium_carterae.1